MVRKSQEGTAPFVSIFSNSALKRRGEEEKVGGKAITKRNSMEWVISGTFLIEINFGGI